MSSFLTSLDNFFNAGTGFLFGPIIVVGLADGEDGQEFTHCNLNASQVRRMLLKEG